MRFAGHPFVQEKVDGIRDPRRRRGGAGPPFVEEEEKERRGAPLKAAEPYVIEVPCPSTRPTKGLFVQVGRAAEKPRGP